ncbi:hypothetical protein K3556_11760 [Aliiroseovarius sp. M344]|uniref:hypothetical protein n=1 Tax=Aliiroseovarius sp. M344 TaxID=2867010 RepID=UPI0021AE03BE|nr:hypothetical protein [Aliiroseovarius sp. M344]UWQ13604.1 hypothetical protein K3556_11760 [Aliiroseovarius sp. M344]
MELLMTAKQNRINALNALALKKRAVTTPRPSTGLKRRIPMFRSARNEISAPLVLV